ncbi:hypothetical protein C2S51_001746 [Perilla frutescens var. frutescens]|nr:hypothetical protein C2S51_001746 [Perilla frutescens var. frutescens]
MGYAAVDSLMSTIHRLVNSTRICLVSTTPEILDVAMKSAKSLREALGKNDDRKNNSEGVMAADARIREEVRKLEDAIESDALTQFLSQSESSQQERKIFLDLDNLTQYIHGFSETAKKMVEEYTQELYR